MRDFRSRKMGFAGQLRGIRHLFIIYYRIYYRKAKMGTNRKVILVSESKEIYESFKRALRYLKNYELTQNTLPVEKNKNDVFLIDAGDGQNNLKQIIELRLRMYLCPIIVIERQIDQEYYSDTAIWYYNIPFPLKELLETIEYSESLSKRENILTIVSWLSRASHDIRGMLTTPDGRSKAVDIINNIFTTVESEIGKRIKKEKDEVIEVIKDSKSDAHETSDSIMKFFNELNSSLKGERHG